MKKKIEKVYYVSSWEDEKQNISEFLGVNTLSNAELSVLYKLKRNNTFTKKSLSDLKSCAVEHFRSYFEDYDPSGLQLEESEYYNNEVTVSDFFNILKSEVHKRLIDQYCYEN